MGSLKFTKKDKSYYTYFEEEYIGFIYFRDFDKFGLTAGSEQEFYIEDVSEECLEGIRDEVINKAFNRALSLASSRECSEYIIRDKLKRKSFPDYAIDDVIKMMYEYNYLNDERFVESYVRSYMLTKSRNMIIRELEGRGINVSEYSEVIDGVYNDECIDEEDAIEKLLDKRFRGQDLSDEKVRRRAANYLQRHGFGYDKIKLYLT